MAAVGIGLALALALWLGWERREAGREAPPAEDVPLSQRVPPGAVQGLPAGATVLVVGIPDIKLLYEVGLTQGGLLGIDCEAIWATTALGFPCGSMLSPDNTEEDRLYVQSRNFAYNDIIELLTTERNRTSKRVHFHFVDAESVAFTGDDISNIDCFHPSAEGQELISALSWQELPFGP